MSQQESPPLKNQEKIENESFEYKVQSESLETQILQIIDVIEDDYLFEGLYQEAYDLMNQIQISEIREDRRILSLQARVSLFVDPQQSEKILQDLFEKDPLFFRNSFEYLTLLEDSYESKAEEVRQRLLLAINEMKEELNDDGYYLACKSLAIKSKSNMKQVRVLMEQSIKKMKKPFQKSDMYSQLGNTYLELKDYQNAIKYYKEGLKIQSKNDECLNNISYCYLEKLDLQKCVIYGEIALQNYPNNSTVLCNLAIAYEELGQIDKAEQAYINIFKNKSIGAVQYANYVQFLFEYRYQNKQKYLTIFDNLIKGFQYDLTLENPIFSSLFIIIDNQFRFTQTMYSYEGIIQFIQFIEEIRLYAPHLLIRICSKIFRVLKILQQQLKDEEFEDVDEDDSGEDEEEEEEEEEELDLEEGNNNEQEQIDSKEGKEGNQQNIKENMEIEEQELEQNIIEHEPYLDEKFLKPVKISQKGSFYSLIHDLVLLKQKENQVVFTLLAYNRFVKEYLHFQKDIQFWDLYYN